MGLLKWRRLANDFVTSAADASRSVATALHIAPYACDSYHAEYNLFRTFYMDMAFLLCDFFDELENIALYTTCRSPCI